MIIAMILLFCKIARWNNFNLTFAILTAIYLTQYVLSNYSNLFNSEFFKQGEENDNDNDVLFAEINVICIHLLMEVHLITAIITIIHGLSLMPKIYTVIRLCYYWYRAAIGHYGKHMRRKYHPSSLLYHSQFMFNQLMIIFIINYIFKYHILAKNESYKIRAIYLMFVGICFGLLLNMIHVIRDLINRDLYNYLRCNYWWKQSGNEYKFNFPLSPYLRDDYSLFAEWNAYCIDKRIKNEQCIICWNDLDFVSNDRLKLNNIKILFCGHIFHDECVSRNEFRGWGAYGQTKLYNYPYGKCPTCMRNYDTLIEKWNYNINYWNDSSIWFNHELPKYGQDLFYSLLWKERDVEYNKIRNKIRKRSKIKW